jgi:hypothetical protein
MKTYKLSKGLFNYFLSPAYVLLLIFPLRDER